MKKNKQLVLRTAIIAFVLLLLCTVFARSVETLLLPQVSVALPKSGALSYENKYSGVFKEYGESNNGIIALDNWKIQEVLAKTGDVVKKGDALFKIDISSYNIQLKQQQAAVQQQKNMINASALSAGDLLVENSKLQALELSLSQLKSKFPANGIIVATLDGYVRTNAKVGNAAEGEELANIYQRQDRAHISFTLSLAEATQFFSQNKDLSVEFLQLQSDDFSSGKMQSLLAKEESFSFNVQTSLYEIVVFVEQSEIAAGTPCVITVKYKTPVYKTLVPLNCVVSEAGGSFVYAIKKRSGIFSQEHYVEKLAVQQQAANHIYVALTTELDTVQELAVYPSRTLRDGEIVRVVK